jgi:ParB-like chromosome segregation protein Spo0J
VQEFDRAGRVRREALLAADELAEALAEAHGGLTIGDLRPGFEALRKARQSEDALAKQAAAAKPGAPRLAPAALPVPQPFIEAAAKLLHAHAELAKELDRLPPEDATRIRARLGDLERQKEEQKREAAPAKAAAAPATPPAEAEAPAPSDTLNIANDAADLIKKKGAPKSITFRPDGLFGLKYEDAIHLVDPDGKLVRSEKP